MMTKPEKYAHFIEEFRLLIEGETDTTAILANTAAALREAFGFFWVGFYVVRPNDEGHDELVLGPFQGSVACYRIRKGRGVCGSAWERAESIVVPDVEEFPGHIACSSLSRSEIVVPAFDEAGTVRGVLDIDSDELCAFDEADRKGLEQVCATLARIWN